MYAVLKTLLKKTVALSACVGNLGGVKRGTLVGSAVGAVGVVAIRADRSHQQPGLPQAATMHAPVVGGLFLLVTLAAQGDLVVEEHWRASVVDRQHTVRLGAVTRAALHGRATTRFVFFPRREMDAFPLDVEPRFGMANAARLFYCFKSAVTIPCRVGLGYIDSRRVASVAVVAINAGSLVHVLGEAFLGNVQPFSVRAP